MTDTTRTCAYLQNLFRDGQPQYSITPQDMRDMIVSALSIAGSVAASGTNQGTATTLSSVTNIVTTVASGTGVILTSGIPAKIMNRGANALSVYPPSGGQIESLATNAAYLIQPGQDAEFYFDPNNALQAYASMVINVSTLATSLPSASGVLWKDGQLLAIS